MFEDLFDAADSGDSFGGSSAADMFNDNYGGGLSDQLGSGYYGTGNSSIGDLMGLSNGVDGSGYDTASGGLGDLLSQAGSSPDGSITGIGWLDKILGNLGDRFNKDPLSMIGSGVGILGALHAIQNGGQSNRGNVDALWASRGAKPFSGVNTVTPSQPGGANPTMFANPGTSGTIAITNQPTARNPGLFVTQAPVGALTTMLNKRK